VGSVRLLHPRALQKSRGARTATPPLRGDCGRRSVGRSSSVHGGASCLLSLKAAALRKRPSPRLHDRARRSDSQRFRRRAAAPAQTQRRTPRRRHCRSSTNAATTLMPQHHRGAAEIGQAGQRRTFAQNGPSGLRAVAGEASATSAAASSPPRKRSPRRPRGRPRPGRGVSPLRSQAPRCPMEQKRSKDTLGLTLGRVCGVPSVRPGDVPRSG
jgi:hypothetical protein